VYIPQHFAETSVRELHQIIREQPFGILVTHTADGLDANHIPFELQPQPDSLGTLHAHIARANPLWKEVPHGADVLVIFRGPHGYISPNWYPSKQETHRHVPTWNYEVVHAHGRLSVVDDPRFLGSFLARLTRRHETDEPRPWKMADAPQDYLEQMLKMVVGIQIELTRLEGKRKLSQNRETRDFEGVIHALNERGQQELSAAMSRSLATKDRSGSV
jgi:transcriptional regulator